MLRAESRLAKRDEAGARQAYEEATALDGRLNVPHLALASLYEKAGEYDKAIDRYRRIVANEPTHTIALNNLAYGLATRANRPQEALPHAQKAYALSKADPVIADTLGWVQHLLGNQAEALGLIAAAAQALPGNAEVRFHHAAVLAATGAPDAARLELTEALRLSPDLGLREEVRALQATLKRRTPRQEQTSRRQPAANRTK